MVNTLIQFLPTEEYDFYIHVDRKSDIASSISKQSNVHFVKQRIDVRWGQFSQVEATLSLMDLIRCPEQYSYCHLISGSDFIIKPVRWMDNMFNENNSKEYIEANYLDGSSTWSWGGLDRMYVYYPKWLIRRPKNKVVKYLRVAYREFVMRTGLFKRKKLTVDKFYGGSCWWSLTGNMVAWMKEYLQTHTAFLDSFRNGICTDEIFFSTLAMLSPYKDNIVNNCMRFMIWGEPGNRTGGPAILDNIEIERLITSDFAFARKFSDINAIQRVIEKINEK